MRRAFPHTAKRGAEAEGGPRDEEAQRVQAGQTWTGKVVAAESAVEPMSDIGAISGHKEAPIMSG